MYERALVHYGLAQQRPDEDDWEPPQLDGLPELDDIRRRISLLEEEHKSRGKINLTGHVIMACHALPYHCSLHFSRDSNTNTSDFNIPSSPTSNIDETIEFRPGDELTMPRSLHSPIMTTPAELSPDESKRSSTRLTPLTLTSRPTSLLDQPKPPGSPLLPGTPARPGPPSSAGLSDPGIPLDTLPSEEDRFRWVLEPRRGHAALNAGIKSLSTYRSITLCAYPADLTLGSGHPLDAAKLSDAQTHALDAGLRNLARSEINESGRRGIECVPVWADEKTAGLHYEGFCKK
ncbi:uncharacterized protein MELLADRAFT_60322 [Melampsora larici-populina 98AG31]|uniref:Uncharacterized protein n=1 Tax=Melampsora larici-populina (strain 98AG31 / pathotype 3-4-7) TaxID=747676 RepID=F4RAX2_MELLP|nr:uncharacterized protein MELLADRAFT_60322 [Melampsora larici-populina 98AG31]EGG10550.1 hypothetical protein MELLADRAFT_60322 [Melampsora larici-populina 98AG31]